MKAPYVIAADDLWPRDASHRYRIYARDDAGLHVLAACPEPGGIGEAIVQIHADQKEAGATLDDLGIVGVLDVLPGGEPAPAGEWIFRPFPRTRPPGRVS